MNSGIQDEVFMSPVAAHQTAVNHSATQDVFKVAVAASILTAVTAGSFSSTTSTSGIASQDCQYVLQILNQAGYAASVSGSTLTASW